jgi:tetratricopeptide (TPR) repeat protein
MTSVAIEAKEPVMGVIRVKVIEQDGLDGVAIQMETLHDSRLRRFKQLGDLSDLDNAMSDMALTVELTDEKHKPGRIAKLGVTQHVRFERLGDLNDLANAITNMEKAVELTDDGHPHQPVYLSNLGNIRRTRFERFGDQSDLAKSISHTAKAVQLTDEGHPDYLWNLGVVQGTRFESLGDLSDLENSISNIEKAVKLITDGHPSKPGCLSNLGNNQQTRFQQLGNLYDLESAISNKEKAVELTGDGHPNQPIYLSNLSFSQLNRFECLGHLSDLANAISNIEKAVELTDDSHPNRPAYLLNLGNSQKARFQHLGNLSDLESAISNVEKAVRLTDDGHPDEPLYVSNLGAAQLDRFECLGFLSDLENAISNIEKAVELTDDCHPIKPSRLSNLGKCQHTRFEHLGDLSDLEKAISNTEKAIKLTGDGHLRQPVYLSNLGNSQRTRFGRLGNLADLENAISNVEKAIMLTDEGHPDKPHLLAMLGITQQTRFDRLGNLSDLKNAILNKERAVELTHDGHPDQPMHLSNLGISQVTCFQQQGVLSDLENAISNMDKALELVHDGHPSKPGHLSNLGSSLQIRFKHLGNLSDLEKAISNKERAVELADNGHPNQPIYLADLGSSQHTRFKNLGDLSDLENAILNQEKAIKLTDDSHPHKVRWLLNLGEARQTRFGKSNRLEDLEASVSSFRVAAQLKAAPPSEALSAARQWAMISHLHGDLQSALDGYRTALALLPKVAWLGLDTHSRQDWLLREKAENLGCLAATCAIQLGHLEEAVELLDLSRSVFWHQAASLRGDLELLREQEPELAQELERVGRQLDAGNFSDSLFTAIDGGDNVKNDQPSTEEIGRGRRRLVRLWEELVERVRQIPQFKYFLRPIPFHQLRQACTAGQVVIINASKYGVDALIFGAVQPVDHAPLPNFDFELLAEMSDDVLLRRPVVATEQTQRSYIARYLKPALRTVWKDILIPIFNKLNVPLTHSVAAPRRRIWWYPTGLLTFIPIHAAGPGTGTIDAGRLIISSYVTSLEMLLQAHNRNRQGAMSGLKFLAVSQPNTSGHCPLPRSTVEVQKLVDAVHSAMIESEGYSKERILHLNGSDATVNRVSGALDSCSWVHLACHGSQDHVFGMKSAFELYDGRLELGEIASKRVSCGRFAFLSACHAASGLQDLPGEAMHLAAGVQFAGFPSVIATMWSIRDDDAPTVANHTYQYLFRNGLQALDPSEAATALNRAILRLREDPNITVDRWAPFIHFGI